MGLAMNRKYKDSKTNELKEEVTFVDVDIFGKQAETAHQYLSKGRACFVEGRLKLDSWDDKQTGQKRSKLKVIAEGIQFLGGKSDSKPSAKQEANSNSGNDLNDDLGAPNELPPF
jgi:single-strand DNA-binding protein